MIYILTGAIRTGKTTALLEWAKNRNDIDGLLCPDDENGKRFFLKLKSKEIDVLETDNKTINPDDIESIGPFHFLKQSFKKACRYLIHASKFKNHVYLVLDELGKLELKNKGLHESALTIISSYELNPNHHLILVIRTSLVDLIIQHYKISKYELLDKSDLTKLI